MKHLIILILAIITGVVAIFVATQINTSRKTEAATAVNLQQPTTKTIDGAINPEMISDRAAYTMLFQLISNHLKTNEPRDRQRLEGYFNMTTLERTDRDALISITTQLQQAIAPLSLQAKEIKNRSFPNPNLQVMEQLTLLERQRETITDEFTATLPNRLSISGLQKLRRFINERIKPKIKILPSAPLPGGAGWQQQSPAKHH